MNSKKNGPELHTVKKQVWVKARQIRKVTGWTHREMAEARVKTWLSWRYTEENKFEYDLNSLNPFFLKQTA